MTRPHHLRIYDAMWKLSRELNPYHVEHEWKKHRGGSPDPKKGLVVKVLFGVFLFLWFIMGVCVFTEAIGKGNLTGLSMSNIQILYSSFATMSVCVWSYLVLLPPAEPALTDSAITNVKNTAAETLRKLEKAPVGSHQSGGDGGLVGLLAAPRASRASGSLKSLAATGGVAEAGGVAESAGVAEAGGVAEAVNPASSMEIVQMVTPLCILSSAFGMHFLQRIFSSTYGVQMKYLSAKNARLYKKVVYGFSSVAFLLQPIASASYFITSMQAERSEFYYKLYVSFILSLSGLVSLGTLMAMVINPKKNAVLLVLILVWSAMILYLYFQTKLPPDMYSHNIGLLNTLLQLPGYLIWVGGASAGLLPLAQTCVLFFDAFKAVFTTMKKLNQQRIWQKYNDAFKEHQKYNPEGNKEIKHAIKDIKSLIDASETLLAHEGKVVS